MNKSELNAAVVAENDTTVDTTIENETAVNAETITIPLENTNQTIQMEITPTISTTESASEETEQAETIEQTEVIEPNAVEPQTEDAVVEVIQNDEITPVEEVNPVVETVPQMPEGLEAQAEAGSEEVAAKNEEEEDCTEDCGACGKKKGCGESESETETAQEETAANECENASVEETASSAYSCP